MTESDQLVRTFDDRARRREGRRDMFRMFLGAAAVGGAFAYSSAASAQSAPSEADVLNFALNLEYLEANFYYYAAFGTPIPTASIGSGGVPANSLSLNAGARQVRFSDPLVAQYAREIAQDELAHVNFLRSALKDSAVNQPQIDVGITPNGAFSSAARAAGFIADSGNPATQTSFFDAYANDLSFLYAAFIFEDVGVTAYKGSSSLLINNKTYIDAAAGILAAEAYHASIIRTTIDQMGNNPGLKASTIRGDTELVSNARDSLDGSSDLDQGIAQSTTAIGVTSNIAPTDSNGIAYSRSAQQVLNVVYLNKAAVTAGGFFPMGVNGNIKTSANNA
ncbi:Ferritin-like domain-containing protein [Sphingomonas gellani]|uniref:Ferritin-like domain-containing protein n=1 Tax=Sphingomonas gellani TaxID=1166340 RepID=A0A1H8B8J8_9SPHN|nr:ferritin-like domain-containing protein [Sphingomonas gellani]SEM79123.1 Ferritin-like domain-containing protein [Sphingomonas gellani]